MVISLAGEWDIYRREELADRLRPALSEPHVVFDLTTAKYITSTLICALILTHKERSQHEMPPMSLAVKSAFVKRLLGATGLEAIFPIYDSVEDALGDDALSA
ncbi:MAG TPA: STAS domain-containing protein [Candidatus Baltobacteraceae bacterium]|jgi:anti-anti-sigma factor|nr:STAS domain-containing protein [Candidatus Baltobacteraceae bacterium]